MAELATLLMSFVCTEGNQWSYTRMMMTMVMLKRKGLDSYYAEIKMKDPCLFYQYTLEYHL